MGSPGSISGHIRPGTKKIPSKMKRNESNSSSFRLFGRPSLLFKPLQLFLAPVHAFHCSGSLQQLFHDPFVSTSFISPKTPEQQQRNKNAPSTSDVSIERSLKPRAPANDPHTANEMACSPPVRSGSPFTSLASGQHLTSDPQLTLMHYRHHHTDPTPIGRTPPPLDRSQRRPASATSVD